MTINKIAAILEAHSVPYKTENGRIYADSMEAFTTLFSETVDVTEYTKDQLYNYLGY